MCNSCGVTQRLPLWTNGYKVFHKDGAGVLHHTVLSTNVRLKRGVWLTARGKEGQGFMVFRDEEGAMDFVIYRDEVIVPVKCRIPEALVQAARVKYDQSGPTTFEVGVFREIRIATKKEVKRILEQRVGGATPSWE